MTNWRRSARMITRNGSYKIDEMAELRHPERKSIDAFFKGVKLELFLFGDSIEDEIAQNLFGSPDIILYKLGKFKRDQILCCQFRRDVHLIFINVSNPVDVYILFLFIYITTTQSFKKPT